MTTFELIDRVERLNKMRLRGRRFILLEWIPSIALQLVILGLFLQARNQVMLPPVLVRIQLYIAAFLAMVMFARLVVSWRIRRKGQQPLLKPRNSADPTDPLVVFKKQWSEGLMALNAFPGLRASFLGSREDISASPDFHPFAKEFKRRADTVSTNPIPPAVCRWATGERDEMSWEELLVTFRQRHFSALDQLREPVLSAKARWISWISDGVGWLILLWVFWMC